MQYQQYSMAETIRHRDSVFNDGQSLWCYNLQNLFKQKNQRTFFVKTLNKSKTKNLSLGDSHIQYSKHKYISLVNSFLKILFKHNEVVGFVLEKNDHSIEIYGDTQEWIDSFKNLTIQLDFTSTYKIVKKIGQGIAAQVYQATNKTNKLNYAAKIFEKKRILLEETEIIAINKELHYLRLLQHQNIIRLYEVFENKQHIIFITDLYQGGELHHSLSRYGLEENQVAEVIKPIITAISFMHSKGIFHRDLKPQNIMLKEIDAFETISLIDLGLADKFTKEGKYLYNRCGTPGYVAPEVLQDKKYDLKVDVYSIGIITYLALTGKEPFASNNYEELVQKNYDGRISLINLNVSENCIDFLKRTLCKDNKLRLSSAEALEHPFITFGKGNHIFQTNKGATTQRMSMTSLRCSTDASSENGSIPKTFRGKIQQYMNTFQTLKSDLNQEAKKEKEENLKKRKEFCIRKSQLLKIKSTNNKPNFE
ncbi:unnamed protein product (macronuclear) [Paramecium tetraurelia]|uniref:Protein kinase domain-containing protein n=1 Tax=Paramecium tetraurelia TaxID=5888 RepID=A0CQW3_PARTE|nr:uncharacterized protein GSPATT00009529001 [Paramecium tetraurelia]CAK73180.1 unnamed protein product [Paramecium tetraurelia]|eukprot:XP_001440577.1 hypothetical protein (macronuclear) [Paramecium tetraurelia strain d4-2]